MVLLALLHAKSPDAAAQARCEARALHWLINMQSRDGGWAAFDVDNNWAILNRVPFADHNAMLDPTCPDITGRVMESLGAARLHAGARAYAAGGAVSAAYAGAERQLVRPLGRRLHLRDVSGDARAARGQRAGDGRRRCGRACEWVGSVQNRGWRLGRELRELRQERLRAGSEHAHRRRRGECWGCWRAAIAGRRRSERGVRYLVETQRPDGEWERGSWRPGRGSRTCSTCATGCIGITSR